MDIACAKLLDNIKHYNKDYFDDEDNHRSFRNIACDIDSYKLQNSPVLIEDVSSNRNGIFNVFALLELISLAVSCIRIYTDEIKDNTYGNPLVIKALRSWIVRYPHRNIKILINKKQNNIKDTKLYKMVMNLDIDEQKRIEVKYLTQTPDTKFNCLIVDKSCYKIKFTQTNKVLLVFNDTEQFSHKMSIVFDRYLKKSSIAIDDLAREIMLPYYLNPMPTIDNFINRLFGEKKVNAPKILNNDIIPKYYQTFEQYIQNNKVKTDKFGQGFIKGIDNLLLIKNIA